MVMDAETRARLKADFANENATQVSTPRMDPETAARLKLEHSRRQKYLNETGGFGGGVQRAADAFIGALGDTGIGVAQALGQDDPAAVKRMQARRDIDTSTNAGRFGNVVGSTVLPTIASGGVTGVLRTLPLLRNAYATRNAIGSGVGGAIIQTGEGESNARNALISAGIGAGPAVARRLFAQPINPTADAQALISRGIYPTPGQAHGGWLGKVESATTSHPIFGSTMSEARNEGFKGYVRERQKDFGYTGNQLGRNATEEMAGVSDEMYNKVLPKLQMEVTPELRSKYLRNVQLLPPEQQKTMRDLITYELDPKVAKSSANIIGGDDLNSWQSTLRSQGDRFAKVKQNAYQEQLGEALHKSRAQTLDEIEQQGLIPTTAADEFANTRKYYGGMRNLMELGQVGGAAKREGLFTPAEDIRWMKNNNSLNRFGSNDVEGLNFAQSAKNTLGETPREDMAGRLAMIDLLKDPKQLVNPLTYAAMPLTLGAWEPVRKFAVGAYGPQKMLSGLLRESEGLAMPTVAPYLTETYNESQR